MKRPEVRKMWIQVMSHFSEFSFRFLQYLMNSLRICWPGWNWMSFAVNVRACANSSCNAVVRFGNGEASGTTEAVLAVLPLSRVFFVVDEGLVAEPSEAECADDEA